LIKKRKLYICLSIVFILLSGCGGTDRVPEENDTNEPRLQEDPTKEPYFSYQWYLSFTNNEFTQSANINKNSSINIKGAWDITKAEGIVVAVIDSNFEPTHKDLAANVFSVYNADAQDSYVLNDSDESSHGTACAGFIAAPSNNLGITGVAPEAKIVLIAQEYVDDAATIRAFEYAKKEGAKIISNSWGTENVSEAVAREFQNLKDQNITIFFASGNDAADLDTPFLTDESELPSVIGVAATNELNRLASYSNYGKNIDILAPGGEFLGLLGLDDSGPKGVYFDTYTFPNGYSLHIDDDHAFVNGTSFACPLAAGVAALMLGANPNLTPDQIREILITTAEKIEEDEVYYDQNGFNIKRAYGKINAQRAVLAARDLLNQTNLK